MKLHEIFDISGNQHLSDVAKRNQDNRAQQTAAVKGFWLWDPKTHKKLHGPFKTSADAERFKAKRKDVPAHAKVVPL